MADLKLSVKAVLGLIFGLMITVLGWYLFPALADILPIASLKAIYWIGIILFWASAVIVTPLIMIMGGKGDYKGTMWGLIAFVSGYILSLVLYYTIGYLLEAMQSVYPNSTFAGIGWFAIYTIWILGLIIVPTGLALKDAISN